MSDYPVWLCDFIKIHYNQTVLPKEVEKYDNGVPNCLRKHHSKWGRPLGVVCSDEYLKLDDLLLKQTVDNILTFDSSISLDLALRRAILWLICKKNKPISVVDNTRHLYNLPSFKILTIESNKGLTIDGFMTAMNSPLRVEGLKYIGCPIEVCCSLHYFRKYSVDKSLTDYTIGDHYWKIRIEDPLMDKQQCYEYARTLKSLTRK